MPHFVMPHGLLYSSIYFPGLDSIACEDVSLPGGLLFPAGRDGYLQCLAIREMSPMQRMGDIKMQPNWMDHGGIKQDVICVVERVVWCEQVLCAPHGAIYIFYRQSILLWSVYVYVTETISRCAVLVHVQVQAQCVLLSPRFKTCATWRPCDQ